MLQATGLGGVTIDQKKCAWRVCLFNWPAYILCVCVFVCLLVCVCGVVDFSVRVFWAVCLLDACTSKI